MEKTSSPTPFGLIDIIFLQVFTNWVVSIHKFFSRSKSFLQSHFVFCENSKVKNVKNFSDFELSTTTVTTRSQQINLNKPLVVDDGSLCREEVEMVMGKMGFFCNHEGEKLEEGSGFEDFSRLFDEEEPTLMEVKEAFYVFDQNRDGFIDAKELQRVLSVLGLKEGLKIGNCSTMIRASDENGDGRIDFNEFVKLMEHSLC